MLGEGRLEFREGEEEQKDSSSALRSEARVIASSAGSGSNHGLADLIHRQR